MHSPDSLKLQRTALERTILKAIGAFESTTGLHVTKVELQVRKATQTKAPKCERVEVVAQIY